jgi:putative methionine-R-sulfoxide reductase with GAF domain/CHASE3 domain sensor protein
MLNQISLRDRLLASFAVVLLLLGMVAVVNIISLISVSRIAAEAYADGLISVKLVGDAVTEALSAHNRLRLYATSETSSEKLRQLEELDKHLAQMNALLDEYDEYHLHEEGGEGLLADFRAAIRFYLMSVSDVIYAVDAGDEEQADALFRGEATQRLQSAVNYLLLLQDIDDNVHRADYLAGQQVVTRSVTISLVVTAVAVVVGVWLALWLARTTAVPITAMAQAADEIAAGNLDTAIPDVQSSPELHTLSTSLSSMTKQLQLDIEVLESTVTQRTKALAASMEVSQQLATILQPQELLKQVVTRVRDAFDYYHVHIYLLDETKRVLSMAGGTGQAGAQMLQQGHLIEVGTGVVGRTAQFNRPVLVRDVATDPEWLPNPLLPETKAEVAVPIAAGNQLLGVLDVQHDVMDGLAEADVELLLSIARQVGVSLQNARFLQEAQTQAQQELLVNEISQQIQSATTIEEALQVAVREIGRALNAEKSSVHIGVRPSPTAVSLPEPEPLS